MWFSLLDLAMNDIHEGMNLVHLALQQLLGESFLAKSNSENGIKMHRLWTKLQSNISNWILLRSITRLNHLAGPI